MATHTSPRFHQMLWLRKSSSLCGHRLQLKRPCRREGLRLCRIQSPHLSGNLINPRRAVMQRSRVNLPQPTQRHDDPAVYSKSSERARSTTTSSTIPAVPVSTPMPSLPHPSSQSAVQKARWIDGGSRALCQTVYPHLHTLHDHGPGRHKVRTAPPLSLPLMMRTLPLRATSKFDAVSTTDLRQRRSLPCPRHGLVRE